ESNQLRDSRDAMAGHSKWAQIKRKKAANDAKRGKMFTKLIREITVAAREAGGDPDMNPRLRLAVDTAKAANMPQDNIDRAIGRGTGDLEGVSYEEVAYEGYGPGGVALYIETLTDNLNRTVAEVRHALEKHGGNLGQTGSVAWQFERQGQIWVDGGRYEEDAAMLAALEAGALDFRREDDSYTITTDVTSFHKVQDGLRAQGIEFEEAELAMVPTAVVWVEGQEAERLLKLLEVLEDLDDVQRVHSNADIDEKVLSGVEA
ncbi:MAG TPA: YebC/PmpR family DNA-binding transcriptional regulator, partial [Longimicrobiales bacterium]|nr:YebC/PmpR family DNA-binding transcriptional regulator [Longimicrobiales bacterium]